MVTRINNKKLNLSQEEKHELQEKINEQLELLRLNEIEFKEKNLAFLQNFKKNRSQTEDEINYPTYLTAIWRKVVHNQCDDIQLVHETVGRGAKGKYIVVRRKDTIASSSSSSDSEEGDYIKEHKPKINLKNKKLMEVLCEPDEVTILLNFSLSFDKENNLFYL